MGVIAELPKILTESRKSYEKIKVSETNFSCDAILGGCPEQQSSVLGEEERSFYPENLLAVGDNSAFMEYLIRERDFAGKIQMIYIDPPFFSRSNYGTDLKVSSEKLGTLPKMKQFAYHDVWETGMEEYLRMLCLRLFQIHELLSDTGCLWVHLDWHSVHYVKILLDEIFGEKNFINEIVWNYKSGGSSSRHFARKHDTLLFYAKTKDYYFHPQKEKSYNRGFKPYRFKGVREYRDENGWYTMVNMKDVWQIDMVGRTSSERTGYATQKPEALLQRILESCTRPGDWTADFFGGSGTLAAASEKMGRRWIYCDVGTLAAAAAEKRLARSSSPFAVLTQEDSEISKHTCRIEAKWNVEPAGATDRVLLTVELTGYQLNPDSEVPVKEKDLSALKKAMHEDPLRFIEFWSIDYSYDGKVHCGEDVFFRNGRELTTKTVRMGRAFQRIHIKAYDIFGNTAEYEADIFRTE